MAKFQQIQTSVLRAAVLGLGLLALSGCEALQNSGGASAGTPAPGSSVAREVDAPEVFSLKARAVWDGRPTFGQIWVGVKQDVPKDLEARLTNLANGKSVRGLVYKIETQNPGPPITVSSVAAAALGIQAGTPVELEVMALRMQVTEVAPEPEPVVEPEPEVATVPAPVIAAPVTTPAATVPAAAPIVPAVPVPTVPQPATAPAAPLETTILKAIDSSPATPASGEEKLLRPLIQVATLSSEVAAKTVVAQLQSKGFTTIVRAVPQGERTLYSVLAGPATTVPERDAMLNAIKALGFRDAFPTI